MSCQGKRDHVCVSLKWKKGAVWYMDVGPDSPWGYCIEDLTIYWQWKWMGCSLLMWGWNGINIQLKVRWSGS